MGDTYLVGSVLEKAENDSSELKPQDISHLILSCGRLGFRKVNKLDMLGTLAGPMFSNFKPQEIANIFWGYAKLDLQPGNKLLDFMATEIRKRNKKFKTMELCILLWSLAVLDIWMETFIYTFAIQLTETDHRKYFRTQCIANTIWAYGKILALPQSKDLLTYRCFLLDILSLANDMLQHFKPQELVQLICTIAQLNYTDVSLHDTVADYSISRLCAFKNRELVLTTWAFGKVKYPHTWLLQSVTNESLKRVIEYKNFPFRPMGLANLLKGFARLDFKPEKLLPLVFYKASGTIQFYQQTEISNLMYAFAKLDFHDLQLAYSVIADITRRKKNGEEINESFIRSVVRSCEILGVEVAAVIVG